MDEMYAAWSRGEFSRADFFTDDAEFVFTEGFPEPGVWKGIDNLGAAMRQWLAPWEDFRIEPERFVDKGDVVVALVRLHARARSSGALMDVAGANVHIFRGERMCRFEIYPSQEAGLRAAGLDPASA
jgi:ketosteroid isomerase-like protein